MHTKHNRKKNRKKVSLYLFFYGSLPAAVIGLLLALQGGTCLMPQTDFLTIREIQVRGCSNVRQSDVLDICDISKGANILSVNLAEKSRQLENNPWISQAIIKRSLPDTIVIQIEEHVPYAVIQLGGYYLISKRGDIFKKVSAPQQGLPLLTGLIKKDVVTGSPESLRVLNAAFTLINTLEHQNTFADKSSPHIAMDKTFGLTLYDTQSECKILLGFEKVETKLKLLSKIQKDLNRKALSAKMIHLNSTKKAYVTLNRTIDA